MRLPVATQHIKEDRGRRLLDFQYTAILIQIKVVLKVNLILFDNYLWRVLELHWILCMFTSNISGYFEGIVGNLQLMPIYYPGWVIRLYHDIRSDDPVMKVYFAFEYSYQNTNVLVSQYMLVFVIFFIAGFMQFSMHRHQHWFMQCSSTSRQTNAERYQNISNELAMVSHNGSAGKHGHKMSRLTLLFR